MALDPISVLKEVRLRLCSQNIEMRKFSEECLPSIFGQILLCWQVLLAGPEAPKELYDSAAGLHEIFRAFWTAPSARIACAFSSVSFLRLHQKLLNFNWYYKIPYLPN